MNVDFETRTSMSGGMGWTLTDVAPEGHPNAGLTILQRMEKYGIDPEGGATSYNRLMRKEREEAVAAGIAPEVPITAEAAKTFAWDIEQSIKAMRAKQLRNGLILAGGGVLVYWLFFRKKRA